ncbi:MAG: calcium/sodium antiporter [Leptospirillia bacterium]
MIESIWLPMGGLVFGFAMLVPAADRFVEGGAATARILGISPLVVGLVIIGFGTSAPEMLVSAMAAWDGRPGLAIGNAIGSNIVNIALVLGIAAMVRPFTVRSGLLRREFPIPPIAALFALLLLLDGTLDRLDGILLLTGFGALVFWIVRMALRGKEPDSIDPMESEYAAEMPPDMSARDAIFWLFAGLTLLLISSRILEWSAVQIAQAWGMSNLAIGLTVVSVGTGLPELATAITAARKGEHEIVIGNVLGSNTFNILAVMGLAGAIQPGIFSPNVLIRDFPVMIGLTVALFAMAYGFRGEGRINRFEGALLVAGFIVYLVFVLHENKVIG